MGPARLLLFSNPLNLVRFSLQVFQSTLGPQQAKMDVTIKSGKVLIDRGEVDDAVVVEAKIAELKERWDGLCALSVER